MKFPFHLRFKAKVRPFSGALAAPVRYRGVYVVTVEHSAVAAKLGNVSFPDAEGERAARSLADAAFATVIKTRARTSEADIVEHTQPDEFFDHADDLSGCRPVLNQPGLVVRLWFEDPERGD